METFALGVEGARVTDWLTIDLGFKRYIMRGSGRCHLAKRVSAG